MERAKAQVLRTLEEHFKDASVRSAPSKTKRGRENLLEEEFWICPRRKVTITEYVRVSRSTGITGGEARQDQPEFSQDQRCCTLGVE